MAEHGNTSLLANDQMGIRYSRTQFVVPRDAGLFAPGGRMQRVDHQTGCDKYVYIPRTQMTLVLIEKGLVLEG